MEVAHKNGRAHKKGSLLLITVTVLIVAVLFGVYVQYKSQLLTIMCKQQDDELVQQKMLIMKLDNDNIQLKAANKQLDDEIKQLKARNKQLDDDYIQLKSTNKQLDDDYKQLKAINKQLDDDNEQFKSTNSNSISFKHVAPVILKVDDFTEKMKNNEKWFSDPFFAFWRGYKMCLRVDSYGGGYGGYGSYGGGYGSYGGYGGYSGGFGGYGGGFGSYGGGFGGYGGSYRGGYDGSRRVTVFLYLMKGPYDDELEQSGHWPLRGMFKVELLDQVNIQYSKHLTIMFQETILTE